MTTIVDLHDAGAEQREQAAALLVDGFRDRWPDAWPDLASAREEVAEALQQERLCFAALDGAGAVCGWIGGIPGYDGNVWELHPLVVRADMRGQGIGSALVRELERVASAHGAQTLWLGTDDETGQTSLYGVDLYPDPLVHLSALRQVADHPFTFYRRIGFAVCGVMPDANGRGKPDIFMAKRIAQVHTREDHRHA